MTTPPPQPPDDGLRDTLQELLRSHSTSNPAFERLLHDYATFHATLVAVAGCFLVTLVLFTVFCWRQRRSSRPGETGVRTFEQRTYTRLGLSGAVVSVLLAVVVAANLGNALDARHGFAGVVTSLGSPAPGSDRAEVQHEFATWLQSPDATTPAAIDDRVDDRLAWQRPKAIISAALLVVVAALGARTWRTALRRSRQPRHGRTPRDRARLALAISTVPVCLVLMLMVIGNTQASVAPLTMTLLFG